jgi:hypothetical protein
MPPPPQTHTMFVFITKKTKTRFILKCLAVHIQLNQLTQVQNGEKTPRTAICDDKSIKSKNCAKNPFATTNIALKRSQGSNIGLTVK